MDRIRSVVSALVITLLVSCPQGARAFKPLSTLDLSGNVESQTMIRHAEIDDFQFVQNRNTVRLRAEWDWLQEGKIFEGTTLPYVASSRLTLLYRGVYDSIYDAAPGDLQHGQNRYDDLVGGRIGDIPRSQRDGIRFENELREAYLDVTLSQLPISLRLGRQQVVWGEADHFRLMDIWNPLDLRWHMHQEPLWDEIRIPLWLMKALWNIGDVGPFSDVYAELVYNPGDYHPGIRAAYVPRPWALPFPDPLRQGQVQFDPVTNTHYSPILDLQGTSDRQGDFHRNPAEASEVGTRLHVTTPKGLDVTLNYFYGRGRNVGAAIPVALRVDSIDLPALPGYGPPPVGMYQLDVDHPAETAAVYGVNVKAKVVHPYVHVFGLTLKYYDAWLTDTSYRLETAYVLGSPYHTIERERLARTTLRGRDVPALGLPTAPLGFTKRDVWSGLIGFDRAMNIPWLNAEAPWFASGQFFWSYVNGRHVDLLRGNAGVGEAPYFGNAGRWVDGAYASRIERRQNPRIVGNADNIRRWEHLATLSLTSFYWNGTLVPVIANLFDPVNLNHSVLWSVDYSLTNSVILTVRQSFYTDFGANVASNDPWFAGGRLHRRDETGVKVTYQF